jgi:hypothetical protein
MVPVVQKELDTFRETIWNTHQIRAQKDTILPDGVPNHIYSFPEQYGLEECGNVKYVYIKGKIVLSLFITH